MMIYKKPKINEYVTLTNTRNWLRVGMYLCIKGIPDYSPLIGVVGEIVSGGFYCWQHKGSCCTFNKINPKDFGYEKSYSISWDSNYMACRIFKKDALKAGVKCRRKLTTTKTADTTGFEGKFYSTTDEDAIDHGEQHGKVLKVNKSIIRKLTKYRLKYSSDNNSNSYAFMIGERDGIITDITQLCTSGGCEDTPKVKAEDVAKGVNVMVAMGCKPSGFAIVRIRNRNFNGNDSLLNNLKTWGVLFPNCIALLVTNRYYGWKLGKNSLEKLRISTMPKILKKGGDNHGQNKTNKCSDSTSCTRHEDN